MPNSVSELSRGPQNANEFPPTQESQLVRFALFAYTCTEKRRTLSDEQKMNLILNRKKSAITVLIAIKQHFCIHRFTKFSRGSMPPDPPSLAAPLRGLPTLPLGHTKPRTPPPEILATPMPRK